jgi:hypothetical protein
LCPPTCRASVCSKAGSNLSWATGGRNQRVGRIGAQRSSAGRGPMTGSGVIRHPGDQDGGSDRPCGPQSLTQKAAPHCQGSPTIRKRITFRHGRACPGHPRLSCSIGTKTWMPGTRPGMTSFKVRPDFAGCIFSQTLRRVVRAPQRCATHFGCATHFL